MGQTSSGGARGRCRDLAGAAPVARLGLLRGGGGSGIGFEAGGAATRQVGVALDSRQRRRCWARSLLPRACGSVGRLVGCQKAEVVGRLDVVAHRCSEVWKRSAHERDVGWRESGADTVSWYEERASSDGSRDEVEIHAGLDVVAGAHVEDLSVEVDGDATALVKISEGVVARRVRNLAVVGSVEPREGTTEVVVGDRERLHAQGDGRHGVHACIIEVCRRLVGREREVLDDDGGDVVEFVDVKSRTTREEGGGRVQHVVVPGGVAADVVSNQAGRRGELALVVEAGAAPRPPRPVESNLISKPELELISVNKHINFLKYKTNKLNIYTWSRC